MENNNDKKPSLIFRSEVQWIIFIVLFVTSILFNYFAVIKQGDMTAYRVTQIEEARAAAWDNYEGDCKEQIELLQTIQADIIKIKTKFDIK